MAKKKPDFDKIKKNEKKMLCLKKCFIVQHFRLLAMIEKKVVDLILGPVILRLNSSRFNAIKLFSSVIYENL